jgi:hypothetical protein
VGGFAVEARVREGEDAAGGAGGMHAIEQAAKGLRHLEAGRVHQDGVETVGELRGKNGFDAGEGGTGGRGIFCASPGFDEARAEDEGGEFFGREHEGREIEFAAQGVADAGFALDGLAG